MEETKVPMSDVVSAASERDAKAPEAAKSVRVKTGIRAGDGGAPPPGTVKGGHAS